MPPSQKKGFFRHNLFPFDAMWNAPPAQGSVSIMGEHTVVKEWATLTCRKEEDTLCETISV